ncbi:MAG: CDP-diacylglycerol--serine O-phosphatidyltransferase [Duncaniella sp.]|nr:CDP-diacylglycerol--serine O-phosphatidyltransferase [Duncaniella sp.]
MKPLKYYIPNTITCLNLLSGALAIIIALRPELAPGWITPSHFAFLLIGLAAVFDFCDGFAARLLKAYSDMGKELDSLSDLVSFGLAPARLVFNLMVAETTHSWLPWTALLLAVFGGLRLAKFNVDTRQTTSFIGLPIPSNAIFWIGFLAWAEVHGYPGDWAMLILVCLFSWLMVSEIPMFSLKFKTWGFKENVRRYVILLAAVLFVITDGLAGFAWTIILYLLISLLGKRYNPDNGADAC